MYIATKNNFIVIMRWTGEVIEQFSLSDIAFVEIPSYIHQALFPHENGSDNGGDNGCDNGYKKSDKGEEQSTKLPPLPPDSIRQFTFAPAIHTFCIVLANGHVIAMQANPKGPQASPLLPRLRAYFLPLSSPYPTTSSPTLSLLQSQTKGVCVALNAHHRLVAVGCETGEVRLFKLPQLFLRSSVSGTSKQQPQLQHVQQPQLLQQSQQLPQSQSHITPKMVGRVLTLLHWGIKGEDTGPVSVVAWTRCANFFLWHFVSSIICYFIGTKELLRWVGQKGAYLSGPLMAVDYYPVFVSPCEFSLTPSCMYNSTIRRICSKRENKSRASNHPHAGTNFHT